MKLQHQRVLTGAYQRGVATLLISMVVLTTITFISLYTARTVLMEQKIATNEFRSNMAFEAAEAGSELGIDFVAKGRDRDVDGLLPGNLVGSDPDEFVFDSDADGTNDTNTTTLPNGSWVTVSLVNADAGDMIVTTIITQGWSDDSAATRTVTQTVALVSPLPNTPENPLTTQGTVVIGGSATVHNPEGNSTIWSGGDVDLGANNSTSTEIADPASANYPDCLGDSLDPCDPVQGSDRYVVGLDVIEYDSNLANLSGSDFFQNFFGATPEIYRETRVTMDIDLAAGDAIGQVHLATNEIIWVEGDVTISGLTVGCTVAMTGSNICTVANQAPSILIINGNLTLQGGPQFYGLVYVAGNVTVVGNTTLVGGVITQGAATNTTGSLDIWYNSALLSRLGDMGPPAGGGGSWRDF
jgi:hypothetical protein